MRRGFYNYILTSVFYHFPKQSLKFKPSNRRLFGKIRPFPITNLKKNCRHHSNLMTSLLKNLRKKTASRSLTLRSCNSNNAQITGRESVIYRRQNSHYLVVEESERMRFRYLFS